MNLPNTWLRCCALSFSYSPMLHTCKTETTDGEQKELHTEQHLGFIGLDADDVQEGSARSADGGSQLHLGQNAAVAFLHHHQPAVVVGGW